MHPLSHDDCRLKVCFLCFKKHKVMHKIKGAVQTQLKKYLKYDILNYINDKRLPAALCTSCYREMYRAISTDISGNKNTDVIKMPNFSRFTGETISTRSNSLKRCQCYLCDLAKSSNCRNIFTGAKPPSNIALLKKKNKKHQIFQTYKSCDKCFGKVHKGISHQCTFLTKVDNIVNEIEKLDITQQEQVTSKLISKINNNNPNSSKKQNVLKFSQCRGKPLQIVVKPSSNTVSAQNTVISINDFQHIQTRFSLSTKTTCGIAGALRVSTKNRKLIEPGLKEALQVNSHQLDNFFDIKNITLSECKAKINKDLQKNIIYCKDIAGFIDYIKQQRNVTEVHFKAGIDGGGSFLKLCLSMQAKILEPDSSKKEYKRQKFNEGVCAKSFKDSSVKKLFILGISKKTQENYDNIKKLWELISIDNFLDTIATDLKLANILVGIMAHSSCFPCCYCDSNKKDLQRCGNLRTIGNCKTNYNAWAVKKSKTLARNFKCCIHPPILSGHDNTKILDILPPPELHLLLGVVNTTVHHMQKEFESDTLKWIKLCNVEREVTRGGTGFKGNSCKILLKKVDLLQSICELGCLKYVEVLRNFNKVVDDCFKVKLNPAFLDSIEKFKISYLNLNISVTPKIHAVFHHVKEFCIEKKKGLGYYSEQAMESVHFDFNRIWSKYAVAEDHPDFDKRLLRAITEYNCSHI